MLSVNFYIFMVSVFILNVILPKVVAPLLLPGDCFGMQNLNQGTLIEVEDSVQLTSLLR